MTMVAKVTMLYLMNYNVVGGLESDASAMLMNEGVFIAEETTVLTFKSDVSDAAFVEARNQYPSISEKWGFAVGFHIGR